MGGELGEFDKPFSSYVCRVYKDIIGRVRKNGQRIMIWKQGLRHDVEKIQ